MGEVLLPPLCAVCGRPLRSRGPVCDTCRGSMERRRVAAGPCLHGGLAVIAAYSYAFPVRQLVLEGKSGGKPWLLDLLVPAMADALEASGLARYPEVIVPVPLHRVRRRERGFDQAVRLGRAVGQVLDIPVVVGGLRRIRITPGQKKSDIVARYLAVHGAFAPGRHRSQIRGRRALLVDDVFTTGATLEAAAGALFEGGCSGAVCLVGARTPSPERRNRAPGSDQEVVSRERRP